MDPAVAEVAQALRGARARTGMSEQQVVAVLAEQGFRITVTRLRGWERTGVIRVDAASRLADVYGITMDSLAGRRAYRARQRASAPDSSQAGDQRRTSPSFARVSSGLRMRTFMASRMRTARSTSWPLPASTPRER